MTEAQEKKNRRIALVSSLGVHAVILLLLLFVVAWRAPNPPLPEYGIELNFGTVSAGSGAIQPQTPAAAEVVQPEASEEVEPLPVPEVEEVVEEIAEEPVPQEAESAQPQVTSELESPVVVEERKETKPADQPREKPEEKVVETKPEPTPTPKQVYQPKSETSSTSGTASQAGTPAGHGDQADKAGDQGDPQGTVDAKALYGTSGGGGGGVSMTGFNGFGTPNIDTPPLPDQSFGTYRFRVVVDDQGYVISVTSLEQGMSFEADRRLKAVIEKLQFIPKGSNLPPQSEGTITFRVVPSQR